MIRIWDVDTGEEHFLIGHDDRINSISWSPDSNYLVSGAK
ncbi:MAG: hypothetical protein AAF394_15180, partial [Planctomycetota bacterium]